MSLSLGTIWNDIKALFKKIMGNAPTVIQDAQVAVAGIGTMAEITLAATDPAAVVPVTAGVNLVLVGLKELQTLAADYQKAPGTTTLAGVQAGVADVQNNLQGILTAAQVKNTATKAKITTIVLAVSQDLTVFESSILAVHPVAAPAPAAPAAS